MYASKPAAVRRFATEAEERAYWESHDSAGQVDWSKLIKMWLAEKAQ